MLNNCEDDVHELTYLSNPNDWDNIVKDLGRYLVLPEDDAPASVAAAIAADEPPMGEVEVTSLLDVANEAPEVGTVMGESPEEFARRLFNQLEQ